MPPSSTRQPLRVGLVGLSASAATSWASTAHLPGLLTTRGRHLFAITALCNSSVDAAHAAIKAYSLESISNPRAYGTSEDLANDANVDIVIISTRVDRHFENVMPSLRAGKDAYIEWPIAQNAARVEEIRATAQASGSRVAVGLQGRWAPPVLALKRILQEGNLGKLLSSDVRAYGGAMDRRSLSEGIEYFADRSIGGNAVVIGFGHLIDYVQSVVGELDPESTNVHMQIQRPRLGIRDAKGGISRSRDTDVPDLISLHGPLQVEGNPTLTALFRLGQPFPGQPALVWTLNCERGEIRLVSPAGISLQADATSQPVTITVHEHASRDSTHEVSWSWNADQGEVPIRARCVQQSLYAFAERSDDGWVTIEDAAARARQIDGWLKQAGFPVKDTE